MEAHRRGQPVPAHLCASNAGKKKKMAPRATSCKDIAVASQFLRINGNAMARVRRTVRYRGAPLDDDRITWSDSLPRHDAAQRQ